ncbi:MAG TPA: glycosyltransferase [Polyangiales bacterium]|nr:glycosyltransferase [Polyangiales bacterium]
MSLQTVNRVGPVAETSAARNDAGWLRHIGMLNDYVRIPYANGSSFASQFFYREFRARGHEVTVVGPSDPDARREDLPEKYLCLPSLPMRIHPGLRMPMPGVEALARAAAQRFDLVLGQTSSELLQLGVYLRTTQHIPFVAVNTLHLRGAYNMILPDALARQRVITDYLEEHLLPSLEKHNADVYNRGDGLVVLCHGLARFWRERGVTVPIHVVPRSVDPKVFERDAGADPFSAPRGGRLLVVGRHTREKSIDRLIRIFAQHVAPNAPEATLTLVGDGPEHDNLKALARELGVAGRTSFPGEFAVTEMARFYRHADLFLYASQSETYGQVVSEALWCGLPAVVFADGMGVSDQVEDGVTGGLIEPGPDEDAADEAFGARVLRLLRDPAERCVLALQAASRTRARVEPAGVIARYYDVFASAREHCKRTVDERIKHPFAPLFAVGHWAAMQATAIGLGSLRRPTTVNRHGRKQPSWGSLEKA